MARAAGEVTLPSKTKPPEIPSCTVSSIRILVFIWSRSREVRYHDWDRLLHLQGCIRIPQPHLQGCNYQHNDGQSLAQYDPSINNEHEPDASKNCSIVATVLCDSLCFIVYSMSNILLPFKPPIILGRDRMTINGPSKEADDDGFWSPVKVIATFGEEEENKSSNEFTNFWVAILLAIRSGRSVKATVSWPIVARRV